jgi:hypothetical protein
MITIPARFARAGIDATDGAAPGIVAQPKDLAMNSIRIAAFAVMCAALPAYAQPVALPGAGPVASEQAAQADAAAAHHERKAAKRAKLHGHYKKAAAHNNAANADRAAANANAANAGAPPPR